MRKNKRKDKGGDEEGENKKWGKEEGGKGTLRENNNYKKENSDRIKRGRGENEKNENENLQ